MNRFTSIFRQVSKCISISKSIRYASARPYEYKNFVMSKTLDQLEKECERFCPPPKRYPPRKVTVLGAGSDVGRIVCLFLKQQKLIRILALYDDDPVRGVLGVANDLAHIDTSPAVEAYQGRMFLKNALSDADVVLICGGGYTCPPCCNTWDRDLFFVNMHFVRTVTIATAQFAPHAIIAVQTPPVDANFALVKYTMKIAKLYDKRKVLGVNAVNAMRANQLFCKTVEEDPTKHHIPVICGTGKCTRVPCFSQAAKKACKFDKFNPQEKTEKIEFMTRLVREADELICKVKSNYEQGHLSIGFSTARFVTSLMKGLFEKSEYIESALVDQAHPDKCFNMKTCATPLTVGKGGIVEYQIPILDKFEKQLLDDSKCDLEDMLNLGRCYAVGDEYYLHSCKIPVPFWPPDCPVVKPDCQKKKKRNK